MEKLGTLESEVLSHEVVDGRVKVVVRTVPGMKLPRVVRPVLPNGARNGLRSHGMEPRPHRGGT